MTAAKRLALAAIVAVQLGALVMIAGCESNRKVVRDPAPDEPAPTEAQKRLNAVMNDTVGGVAFLQGQRFLAVRGYGLVVGLGTNGTRECPEPLRGQMLQMIRKKLENDGMYSLNRVEVKAKELMDSLDTAVVEVSGIIPPGAAKGSRFDVFVRAVAGTETRSLEGGRLYSCDLHIYRDDGQGGLIHGKVVAAASGRIFQSPGDGSPASQPDLRSGLVLGGGENLAARTMDLALATASHRLARQITHRVNEHFGKGEEIAKAMSPSRIEVKAPSRGWRNKEDHLFELVVHLPLTREEDYLVARAEALIGLLRQENPPAEDIALVLEAMGQPAVPVVQRFYTDSSRAVRYYAARVGLRLRDDMAVDVLGREAAEVGSPFREAAVAELSNAGDVAMARIPLRDLINDPNPKIRVLAYEGLSKHNDEKINRYLVDLNPANRNVNFVLDIVPSQGETIVYATRAIEGRIAVIGRDLSCRPPFYYLHPNRMVSVTAGPDAKEVTIIRRAPAGIASPEFKMPLELGEMVRFLGDSAVEDEQTGKIKGVELSYSQVLQVLQSLCEVHAIPGTFELQRQMLSDSLGSIKPMVRPESEIAR